MRRAVPNDLATAEDMTVQSDEPIAASAPTEAATVAAAPSNDAPPTNDDILAAFGIKLPATPPPIVGVLFAIPEDPFKPVGEGAERLRDTHEFARGIISHDPAEGDRSIRAMEAKGFTRLPKDFPVRLAGVQGANDVMLIRTKEQGAWEHAKEAAERKARKIGIQSEQRDVGGGVKSTVKTHRRIVPRELAGV